MYHLTPPPQLHRESSIDHRAIHLAELRIQHRLQRAERARTWRRLIRRPQPAVPGGQPARPIAIS